MRVVVLIAGCVLLRAQAPEPAREALDGAYAALRSRDYAAAIEGFGRALKTDPKRSATHKDLAYTYLKTGERELARDEFRAAMWLDPADTHVAAEYAYLCNETGEQAEARRVFDRLRKAGDTGAEQAFENIDGPLRAGIDRWKSAIAMGSQNFSSYFELATLAEQRDELELAAEHYEKAWRILPDRRSVLVRLGRVWRSLHKDEAATAALVAAAFGGEPYAAEAARELLPERHPYVAEFRAALSLDSSNAALRRELAYLLLRMGRTPEAEREFAILAQTVPEDLLSATQLGFLLYARGEQAAAMPLFERVLAGKDEDLANRVRAVLRLPQLLKRSTAPNPPSIDAKLMAERSIQAGYMKDALKYLTIAQEADPVDFGVMLRLGWTYNALHQDPLAVRWFDLARRSPDPLIASEAARGYRNLHSATTRFRTSMWAFPVYSSRWHDAFAYAQLKTDFRTGLGFRPYLSIRMIGDTRGAVGTISPQYLSESSAVLAAGVLTEPRHGVTAWGEAGWALGYLNHHFVPDYRGGISLLRSRGHSLAGEAAGWFADTSVDGVFISRFGYDSLLYLQGRAGYTAALRAVRAQWYWNGNLTVDAKREAWANFGESGPGVRFNAPPMPRAAYFTINFLRGWYLRNEANPYRGKFNDFRAGVWYAITR